MSQIVLESPVSGRVLQAGADGPQGSGFLPGQEEKDLSLPWREVMRYPKRSNVADRQEADSYCSVLFEELGRRVSSTGAQLDDLLCSSTPTLNQAPAEERFGNQGIARA